MSPSGPLLQKLGGTYQLVLETAEDLPHLEAYDTGLWAVSSAPLAAFHGDPALYRLLDADGDGRIQSAEVRAACAWIRRMLRERGGLSARTDELRPAWIDDSHDEGRALRETAEELLAEESATALTLAAVRERRSSLFTDHPPGTLVPADVVGDDPVLAGFIETVLAVTGQGEPVAPVAVDEAGLDRFLALARAYLDWSAEGDAARPWGEATDAAHAAMKRVEAKIDEYFQLCGLVRLRPDWVADAGAPENLPLAEELAAAPLARPQAAGRLSLRQAMHPQWRNDLRAFAAALPADRLSESGEMDEAAWEAIKAALRPFGDWLARRPFDPAGIVEEDRLAALLAGDAPARLRERLEREHARAARLARLGELEKLLLFQRHLLDFLNEFVTMQRLYDPERTSSLQAGSLLLDGRYFNFCVPVTDRNEHKRIARGSHICLIYAQILPRGDEPAREIAAAVTAGRTHTIWPGRHGIFRAADGRLRDALVVDMLENPVGLWEAVQQPFKKLGGFIEKQAERFSSTRYTEIETSIDKSVAQTGQALQAPPPPEAPPAAESRARGMRDLLMGGGVALAAVGGTFALITQTLAEVRPRQIVWALGVFLLLVLIPTLVVAAVKLGRRNLAVLLEASGLAINPDLYLDRRIEKLFTRRPVPPAGARRKRLDRARAFARRLPEVRVEWELLLLLLVCAGLALLPWLAPSLTHWLR